MDLRSGSDDGDPAVLELRSSTETDEAGERRPRATIAERGDLAEARAALDERFAVGLQPDGRLRCPDRRPP